MIPNGYADGEASPATTVGRPRALDSGHLELVLTLHGQDKGYRAIARGSVRTQHSTLKYSDVFRNGVATA